MYELPTYAIVNNKKFAIRNKGDFRLILDCLRALDDPQLSDDFRIMTALVVFYEDLNSIDEINKLFEGDLMTAVKAMYEFINCGQFSIGRKVNYKLIDWEQDEQLICGEINKIANCEVRLKEYLHWWTFMSYYIAIGDGAFSHIVYIRHKMCKGKKLDKSEIEFKRENPEFFTWKKYTNNQQHEADDLFNQIWNRGK